MNIWSVASHHCICKDPVGRRGVLITADDLEGPDVAVWTPDDGAVREISPTTIKATFAFRPSECSVEYRNVLRSLLVIEQPGVFAVVSLEWAPRLLGVPGFLTTKRVWLSLFHDELDEPLWEGGHEPGTGRPYYTFLDGLNVNFEDMVQLRSFFENKLHQEAVAA